MDWLIDTYHHDTAHAKLEVSQLEARLAYILYRKKFTSLLLSESIDLCLILQQKYQDCIGPTSFLKSPHKDDETLDPVLDYQSCFQLIQELKTENLNTLKIERENRLMKIIAYYSVLLDLLQKERDFLQKTADNSANSNVEPWLYRLVKVSNQQEWLKNLVDFAMSFEEINENRILKKLGLIEKDHLLMLSNSFIEKSHQEVIYSIFYYKLHPELLYKNNVHPEKLISTKIRLKQTYYFIELFFECLKKALQQKGLPEPNDNLLHGEGLPKGINIQTKKEYQDLVEELVKRWSPAKTNSQFQIETHALEEILRAYKYRFNPSRLIDVSMNLQQTIQTQLSEKNNLAGFKQFLLRWYSTISMTKCLDLYGYFSNKETAYLMRTLDRVSKGYEVQNIPSFDKYERQALRNVHQNLTLLTSTLREELSNRKIHTSQYPFESLEKKLLSPRKRIQRAILRVVKIYKDDGIKINLQIEDLFEKLES